MTTSSYTRLAGLASVAPPPAGADQVHSRAAVPRPIAGGTTWGVWARALAEALPRKAGPLRILEVCADDSRAAWYLCTSLGRPASVAPPPSGADQAHPGAGVPRSQATPRGPADRSGTPGAPGGPGHPIVAEYHVTGPGDRREWRMGAVSRCGHVNPEQLPYPDRSFDVVCGFDVLRRCRDPRSAAAEIARVARLRMVLLEWNGLSVRRILAGLVGTSGWTHRHRLGLVHTGEGVCPPWEAGIGHAPWRLKSWFPRPQFSWLGLRPVALGGPIETSMARVKGLRWQCRGVLVVGQRRSWRAAWLPARQAA